MYVFQIRQGGMGESNCRERKGRKFIGVLHQTAKHSHRANPLHDNKPLGLPLDPLNPLPPDPLRFAPPYPLGFAPQDPLNFAPPNLA